MKVDDIVKEGFWDSLATGLGATELGTGLKAVSKGKEASKERAQRRALRIDQQAQQQAALSMKPRQRGPQPTVLAPAAPAAPLEPEAIMLQPGERLDITIPPPKGSAPDQPPLKYYKTVNGWFTADNRPVPPQNTAPLERVADASGRITNIPVAATPATPAVAKPVISKPLTAKQQERYAFLAARKAAAASTSPKPMAKTPVYNPKGSKMMEDSDDELGQRFTGYNEWKQEISMNTVGFAKFKEDKFGNEIARLHGKVVGVWDNNGEGIVYEYSDDHLDNHFAEDVKGGKGVKSALAGAALAAMTGCSTPQGSVSNLPDSVVSPQGEILHVLSNRPKLKPIGSFEVKGKKYIVYPSKLAWPVTESATVEKAKKLINEYTIKEMAVRRLRKEKDQ